MLARDFFKQGDPLVAVLRPSAEVLHAQECGFAHALLESRIVGELLHAGGEGADVADGHDEAFDLVGEEVFRAGVGAGEHGASAGHGLSLHEGEALFDRGKDEDVAGAHEAGKLGLRDGAEELHLAGGEAVEDGLHVRRRRADDAQTLGRVLEAFERLEEVRDTLAQADRPGEQDLEAIFGRVGDLLEVLKADPVGDGVDLLGGHAHLEEGAAREGGGHGDGVSRLVALLLAQRDADVGGGVFNIPAALLVGDDLFLVAMMGGATIAEVSAAALLNQPSGLEAGAGDADEGIAWDDAAQRPLVEEESVCVIELVTWPGGQESALMQDHLGRVDPGEGFDACVGQAFTLQARPGPGGIDATEMATAFELAAEFKVVKDTEDGLGHDHAGYKAFRWWVRLAAMAPVYRGGVKGQRSPRGGRLSGMIRLLALTLLPGVLAFAQATKPNPRDARIASVVTVEGAPSGWVQTMDYYAPAGEGLHPAVIIVHGGGFTGGTSRNGSEAYCADFLAPAGYAVFSTNYRLAPANTLTDMVADVQRAIGWVKTHAAQYNVDPKKVVLLGGSAGGYLSNMVGVKARHGELAAVVTLYGISNLAEMPKPEDWKTRKVLGDTPVTEDALLSASPLSYVGKGEPPFLLIHGDHDESVPFQQSVNLRDALRAQGNTAELIAIPGGIHGTWTWHALPDVPDWEREMVEWLNKTVGRAGPIGAGIEARTPPPSAKAQ